MSGKVAWTPEDEELLKQLYPTTPNKKLATRLRRTPLAISMKATNLGLTKIDAEKSGIFTNSFEPLTRKETLKLDKIDLLGVNWGLLEMFRRELNNPELRTRDRIRLLHTMSSHTATISAVMKGSEDQLGEEDDLRAQFIRLEYKEGDEVTPRRIRYGRRTYAIVEEPVAVMDELK
jgi:hypothetical protein